MTSCAGLRKYAVGQKVRVEHPTSGSWVGTITYASSSWGPQWEYEVSNAPTDRADCCYGPFMPGARWHPLLWEEEIVEVIS